MDHLTVAERSALMSRIRRNGTTPERIVRRVVRRLGYKARSNVARLPGSPDVVIEQHSIAIFVHGCYWHRHTGCKAAGTPKSRTAYWLEKFDRNTKRDRRVAAKLRRLGWKVVVVWGCQTQLAEKLERRIAIRLRVLTDKS